MKAKKKYLALYEEWMKTKVLPGGGLCVVMGRDDLFKLFLPTDEERYELSKEATPVCWWGRESFNEFIYEFGPRRQTIVLFMAAINNEL